MKNLEICFWFHVPGIEAQGLESLSSHLLRKAVKLCWPFQKLENHFPQWAHGAQILGCSTKQKLKNIWKWILFERAKLCSEMCWEALIPPAPSKGPFRIISGNKPRLGTMSRSRELVKQVLEIPRRIEVLKNSTTWKNLFGVCAHQRSQTLRKSFKNSETQLFFRSFVAFYPKIICPPPITYPKRSPLPRKTSPL